MTELRSEALQTTLREVEVAGEPLFELDAAALLLAALEGRFENGPVSAHTTW